MASSKEQKKDKTDNDEGKKYNCQCGDSFSSVEDLNDHNHKAH
ncbi:MAG TPA: hypothetical protein VIZ62_03140 [Nitrososphaeraceae archaeon]